MTEKKSRFSKLELIIAIIGVLLTALSVIAGQYYFMKGQKSQNESNNIASHNIEKEYTLISEKENRNRKIELYTKISSSIGKICATKDTNEFRKAVIGFDSLYDGTSELYLSDYSQKQMKSFHIILTERLEGSDVSMTTIKLAASSLQKNLSHLIEQEINIKK